VLDTDNIKVGGESKGVPKAEAPAVNLTVKTSDKSAADAVKDATQQTAGNEWPSVIIVEVLGYAAPTPRPRGAVRTTRAKYSLSRKRSCCNTKSGPHTGSLDK
jgi:hypothetical protein